MGDGKIADPLTAPLFVKLANQFLQRTTFNHFETLIGVLNQFVDWPKRDRGNGVGECRQPRTEKIVGDIIPTPFRIGGGEYR